MRKPSLRLLRNPWEFVVGLAVGNILTRWLGLAPHQMSFDPFSISFETKAFIAWLAVFYSGFMCGIYLVKTLRFIWDVMVITFGKKK